MMIQPTTICCESNPSTASPPPQAALLHRVPATKKNSIRCFLSVDCGLSSLILLLLLIAFFPSFSPCMTGCLNSPTFGEAPFRFGSDKDLHANTADSAGSPKIERSPSFMKRLKMSFKGSTKKSTKDKKDKSDHLLAVPGQVDVSAVSEDDGPPTEDDNDVPPPEPQPAKPAKTRKLPAYVEAPKASFRAPPKAASTPVLHLDGVTDSSVSDDHPPPSDPVIPTITIHMDGDPSQTDDVPPADSVPTFSIAGPAEDTPSAPVEHTRTRPAVQRPLTIHIDGVTDSSVDTDLTYRRLQQQLPVTLCLDGVTESDTADDTARLQEEQVQLLQEEHEHQQMLLRLLEQGQRPESTQLILKSQDEDAEEDAEA
eukprot:m.882690 g.882690  ORF g.882690 m.882690 type:complete len:369 (-) comp59876_c0_seq2:123-1229(-)